MEYVSFPARSLRFPASILSQKNLHQHMFLSAYCGASTDLEFRLRAFAYALPGWVSCFSLSLLSVI